MTVFAPAKINLSLRVVRRREDGFHEIDSLMVPVSIFDRIEIEKSDAETIHFTCDDSSLATDDSNLVVRAARTFRDALKISDGLRISLHKGIPHGAGLGGGSSDAAATLLALDEMFETHASRETLHELAGALGSDVPFFLDRTAARVAGRGEKTTPIAFPHTIPLLLVKPPFGVPTPWAYRQWRDSREIPGVRFSAQDFSWGTLINDLERPVFEKFLLLADIKMWLLGQSEVGGALMAGSGATVFAVLREKSGADSLREKMAAEFGGEMWCRACETIASNAPLDSRGERSAGEFADC